MESLPSTSPLRKWAELSAHEEEEKLKALGLLLKENGLTTIQPMSADHQVHMIKSGYAHKQSRLMITGKVQHSQADQAQKFTHDAKVALAGINPHTYLIRIDVEPLSFGSKYEEIKGLARIETQEQVSLSSIQGQALVIAFWSSWCKPSYQFVQEVTALQKSSNLRIVAINVDDNIIEATQTLKDNNLGSGIELYHVGASNSDLIYGGKNGLRLLLIDQNGKIAYNGLPKKITLQDAVATLVKGETITLTEEVLHQDESSAPENILESKGTYKETETIAPIKEEMDKFAVQLSNLCQENEIIKKNVKGLLTDSILTLRQTRVDPVKNSFLTKYLEVNSLSGPEPVVTQVRDQLESFFTQFGGSFQKEWEVTMVSA